MSEERFPEDGFSLLGSDPDLEARLLALINGEASDFEAEALGRLMADNPRAGALFRALEEVHGLVGGSVVREEDPWTAEWKLSPDRRGVVLATLGIGQENDPVEEGERPIVVAEAAREVRIQRSGRKVLWGAAACLLVNLILFGVLIGQFGGDAEKSSAAPLAAMMEEDAKRDSRSQSAAEAPDASFDRDTIIRRDVPDLTLEIPNARGGISVPKREPKSTSNDFGSGDNFGGGWGQRQASKPGSGRGAPSEESAESEDDPFSSADLAQREIVRRGREEVEAERLLKEGKQAAQQGKLAEAQKLYAKALEKVPPAAEKKRKEISEEFASGSVALAQEFGRTGRYEEAREKLGAALTVDPANQAVRRELEAFDHPLKRNPALTYEHTQNVDKVRRQLYIAEGEKNAAKYDDAVRAYEKVLQVDPYNTAARRGMERIHRLKSDHYRAAYDETRARLLGNVDESWTMAVPPAEGDMEPDSPTDDPFADADPFGSSEGGLGSADPFGGGTGGLSTALNPRRPLARNSDLLLQDADRDWHEPDKTAPGVLPFEEVGVGAGESSLNYKLKNIIIDKIDLDDVSVEEALDFVRQKAAEADTFEIDPARRGMNLVLRKARIVGPVDAELEAAAGLVDEVYPRVKQLKLTNVPVATVLQYIAEQSRLRYKIDDHAITLLPVGRGEGDDILTRRWRVGPKFFADLSGGLGNNGSALRARKPLKELLQESGIDFPDGASAHFIPSSRHVIVSNTPQNLDLMDQLMENMPQFESAIDQERYKQLFQRQDARESGLSTKLKTTYIDEIDFDGVTVSQALKILQEKAQQQELSELTLGEVGIPMHVVRTGEEEFDPEKAIIRDLKLKRVPLAVALGYICDQTRLRYVVEADRVNIHSYTGGESGPMITSTYMVHADLMKRVREGHLEPEYEEDDPFEHRGGGRTQVLRPRRPIKELMEEAGISFGEIGSAEYNPATGLLTVKATEQNQTLVESLFGSMAIEMAERSAIENGVEKSADHEPFSTFSLHISDVSFKLAKATLANGQWPAQGQVRVEEFVNAFDYEDATPQMAQKVSCALESAQHPFMQQRRLMRIAMKTAAEGRGHGIPLRLTVLLDNSGSMARWDRARAVQKAFDLLATQIKKGDQVSLISFARKPRLLADGVSGLQVGRLSQLVADLPTEGGTNLEEALRLGMQKARAHHAANGMNRIILLTDGAANLGNAEPEDLAKLVEEMRESNIAFDACGVGADGLNDEILESLTRKGDGRYYFLDRPEDADDGFARQIAGALRPAARNVKVQVFFNPDRVGSYKLFGFDKHRLNKEDFRNDKVDAAEVAAEEAGNAVYQYEVKPDGEGEIGTVSVRFQDMATKQMVERRWSIPYEPQVARFEEAKSTLQLAASAAFLGEKLDGSEMGNRVNLAELAPVVNDLPNAFTGQPRVNELVEMWRQARDLE